MPREDADPMELDFEDDATMLPGYALTDYDRAERADFNAGFQLREAIRF